MKRKFSLAAAAASIATAAALWVAVPAGAATGHQAVSGPRGLARQRSGEIS
jgi:hypothetical protein